MTKETSETTATDVRQTLSEQAAQLGWQRTQRERVDIYRRGASHVHAMWRDSDTVNGGAHYEDSILLAYTPELAKIQSWLAR
ncbi:hypothetical protein [Mycolicibacter kumamotonensis]|jgi:hypothetical protein|uniref:Uncharacterized protein n=1 Tax=Mycolicibacter kumamotonensis TaxID=354243 RepID=A0A1B8SJB1_9MYCO|nr:hypothetical protein [Mycolicibacter kumamotonensis]NDJ89416.1 hypothetical protein [Mycolicibacter kumamotonensis]OBY32815.1 hypothetical protein ACT18_05145 [Mycolicibacter kumamotonensis]ORA79489.1 hypothetical protein BST28_11635 [Mycolicibacter kumamotonensis]